MRTHLRARYGLAFVLLLLIETVIGLYVRDHFIRPFLGDALIIVLMFVFFQCFRTFADVPLALVCTAIGWLAEWAQYWHLLNYLHWQHSALARLLLGAVFDPHDLLAYSAGGVMAYALGRLLRGTSSRPLAA